MYKDRDEIPWTDDELRLLYKIWAAVHARRFDGNDPLNKKPDTIYAGVLLAEHAIYDIVGMELGYSYGWLPELLFKE